MPMHLDCCKVWGLLTPVELKASQLEVDGVSIVSRITELEIKSKIEFECADVITTNNEDNAMVNKGL